MFLSSSLFVVSLSFVSFLAITVLMSFSLLSTCVRYVCNFSMFIASFIAVNDCYRRPLNQNLRTRIGIPTSLPHKIDCTTLTLSLSTYRSVVPGLPSDLRCIKSVSSSPISLPRVSFVQLLVKFPVIICCHKILHPPHVLLRRHSTDAFLSATSHTQTLNLHRSLLSFSSLKVREIVCVS